METIAGVLGWTGPTLCSFPIYNLNTQVKWLRYFCCVPLHQSSRGVLWVRSKEKLREAAELCPRAPPAPAHLPAAHGAHALDELPGLQLERPAPLHLLVPKLHCSPLLGAAKEAWCDCRAPLHTETPPLLLCSNHKTCTDPHSTYSKTPHYGAMGSK